ncbi:hypothetical protein AX14_002216 [Amanita brunnescens Koide BX004]|nr:hypothetical protein AX14_002216 [Amanita brunnescens Koide BX004]
MKDSTDDDTIVKREHASPKRKGGRDKTGQCDEQGIHRWTRLKVSTSKRKERERGRASPGPSTKPSPSLDLHISRLSKKTLGRRLVAYESLARDLITDIEEKLEELRKSIRRVARVENELGRIESRWKGKGKARGEPEESELDELESTGVICL